MLEEKLKEVIKEIPDFPKPGISFKDITPLLSEVELYPQIIDALAQPWKSKVDVVLGVESRGFLFGMGLAQALKIPFIPIRKKGKLPRSVISESYKLEYGSACIEIHEEDLCPNSRVLIHDDLLATGGTAMAASKLVKKANAIPSGFSFIVELEFLKAANELQNYAAIHSLLKY